MRVAIAGATGAVGRHVVDVAAARGHDVVPLSRSHGLDISGGGGLGSSLAGTDVVIDVLNTSSTAARASKMFFSATTTALLAGGAAAGTAHHIALSIVGIDEAKGGYYEGKVCQESLIADSKVPWTVLRSTQLHEFVPKIVSSSPPGPFALVPHGTLRPVAAIDVAGVLVDAAESGPHGRLPDLAGPLVEELPDLARRLLKRGGFRRRVVPLRLPGGFFVTMRDGSLLPQGAFDEATTTFDEWLDHPASVR